MPSRKSDRKITQDRSGRFRIGGRFASARQVSSVKGARTRRGQTTKVFNSRSKKEIKDPFKVSRKRKIERKKARGLRARFVSERITERQGFVFRSWEIPEANRVLIQQVIDAESVADEAVLVYPVIEALDEEGMTFHISNSKGFYRDANDPNVVEQLIEDIEGLESKYEIKAVVSYSLVFTFSR